MVGTQNETSGFRKSDCGLRNVRSTTASYSAIRNPQSAFTLTELLVVITIIAILAGLITGAAVNALGKAKQAAITLELQQLATATEDFKNELGAYPPNCMNNNAITLASNDVVRMFKKAFPRSQEPEALIQALAFGTGPLTGITNPHNVTTPRNSDGSLEGGGLIGEEALFFWLGGFSKDPAYPISGPGGPSFSDADGDNDNTLEISDEILENRNLRYEFDLGRLGPKTADGVFDDSSGNGRYIEYDDPRVSNNPPRRRINLWVYTPSGSQVPMVYFDASRHDPEDYDLDITGLKQQKIYALKQLRQGVSAATSNVDIRFVADKKFQIMHPGTDDIWGNFESFQMAPNNTNAYSNIILFPAGPFIGDVADTLGNFMTGALEDEQE